MQARRAKSDVMTYFVGSVLSKLVGFIMLPIYTAVLSPKDYGIIGLMAVCMSVFETALGARVAQAVPKFYFSSNEQHARQRLVSSALISTLIMGMLISLVFFSSSGVLSLWVLGDGQYTYLLQCYSVTLLGSGLEGFGLMYLRLHNRAKQFVLLSLLKLLLQLSLNILFVVYWRIGVLGVVISGLISSLVLGFYFLGRVFVQVGWHFDRHILWRLFVFCWPLWLSGLALLYMSSINQLLIRYFSSLADVGLFALAMRFCSLITLFAWTPFSNWWQTERFKIYNNDPEYAQSYRLIFHRVAGALFFSALGVGLFSGLVIELMADEAFFDASYAVAILAIGWPWKWLATYTFSAFFIQEKTKILANLRYFQAAVVTLLLILLIPQGGFIGAALALTLSECVMFFLAYFLTRPLLNMGVALNYLFSASGILLGCFVLNEWVLVHYGFWLRLYATLLLALVGSLGLYFMGGLSLGRSLFSLALITRVKQQLSRSV